MRECADQMNEPVGQYLDSRFLVLFADNPLPMWVYDAETLRFLEVNNAAVERYGYSREEFLAMSVTEIRPAEDVARLLGEIEEPRPEWLESGRWRHRLKSGQIIHVQITSHVSTFAGR